jgi:hypothetical protein
MIVLATLRLVTRMLKLVANSLHPSVTHGGRYLRGRCQPSFYGLLQSV